MDCTICTMGSSRIKGFSASCSKAVSVPEIRSPGPDGERTSTSGSMCADPRSGCALQRRRMPFAGLQLHHGLRGGCAAPESEAVPGATPRPGRFACHGEGWDVHAIPNPLREVAPGPAVLGRKAIVRLGRARPVLARATPNSPMAKRSANRPAAYSKRRPTPFRTDCWLGVTPKRRGGWGCTSPFCPMPIEACRDGGRSQPRLRRPDRHRRSGGRGATAIATATCGTGGEYIEDPISCPATPEVPCTLADRHRHGPPAPQTGLSEAGG